MITTCLVVIAVSNLACGLYNRRLYDQAFTLVEILCKDLCKNCPASLSVDRVNSLNIFSLIVHHIVSVLIHIVGAFFKYVISDKSKFVTYCIYMLCFTLTCLIVMSFEWLVEPSLHVGGANISADWTAGASTGLGDPVAEGFGGQNHDSYGRTGLSVGENKD